MKNSELLQWSKLGPRAMFGKFMLELANTNKNLIVLSADLGRSSGLDRFKQEYPEKYISIGISEQNLIGIASGLAKQGHKVFVTSFAPFLSMRASEQIRMNLGYMAHNVNIVALGSGLSMGFLGNSHFGLEDLAIMRTIPGLNIISPADCLELKKTLSFLCIKNFGPTYIRLTGTPGSSLVYEKNYKFDFKKNHKILDGKNVLVLSYGSVLTEVRKACIKLKSEKISSTLLNIKTIKPLDLFVLNYIKKFEKIVIIEEHTTIGGLGEIISSLITKNNIRNKKIFNISLPDKFGPTGSYQYLLNYHKLSSKKIFENILSFCNKK